MHKTRAVSVGGVLRGYFKALESEPEDLIGSDDEAEKSDDDTVVTFQWNTRIKKYILIRTYSSGNLVITDELQSQTNFQDTG